MSLLKNGRNLFLVDIFNVVFFFIWTSTVKADIFIFKNLKSKYLMTHEKILFKFDKIFYIFK